MPNQNNHKRRSKKQPSFKKRVLNVMKANADLQEIQETTTDTSLTDASSYQETIPGSIPQGDGQGQRVGDRLEIKDVSIKASVFSGTASGLVRCMVYQGLEDVPPDSTAMTLLPNDFYPKLSDTNSRYKILYDKVISLDPDYRSSHLFNIRIPASKLGISKLQYDPAQATALVGGGTIFLRITTDNATASQMTVDSNYRFRYVDM